MGVPVLFHPPDRDKTKRFLRPGALCLQPAGEEYLRFLPSEQSAEFTKRRGL